MSKCDDCTEGYYKESGSDKCEKKCEDKFKNCEKCNERECIECAEGYFSKSGVCLSIDAYIPNCVNLNIISFQCDDCKEGYELKSVYRCVKSDANYFKISTIYLLFILFILS